MIPKNSIVVSWIVLKVGLARFPAAVTNASARPYSLRPVNQV